MIRRLFKYAEIGHRVCECAAGIATQERFAGKAPVAAFSWSTREGEFEVIVVRKDAL